MRNVDLLIIGGGSAGMSAAISAYKEGIKDIVIIEKNDVLGGILNQCIHNGFGLTLFKEELTGPEFLTRLANQINELHIEVKYSSYVNKINKNREITYINSKEGYQTIKAKAIIVATGCYERNAGAIAIPGSRPSGVLTAGAAQLYLNKYGYLVGKKIFILGSGDIGLIMARRFTLEGAKVLGVAEIMPYSNGLNRNLVQCLDDYNIPLYLSHTVSKIIGKNHVEAVEVSKVDEHFKIIEGSQQIFDVDTLILSIGLIPNSDLLSKAGATISSTKGANVNELMETNIPGVFTCGNVLHVHDLVDFVVLESQIAGRSAALFIKGAIEERDCEISCIKGNGISYVVPESCHINPQENVEFKFRVSCPKRNIAIVIKLNDKIIKKITKIALIPSQMEIIQIDKNLLNEKGILSISLEEINHE